MRDVLIVGRNLDKTIKAFFFERVKNWGSEIREDKIQELP